jgi:membrane protein YdbS with pleckstrin-like domain
MLSTEEEKFLRYWKDNRGREKSPLRQLSMGLPIGLLIGAGIILNFATGWYTRANMVANSQSTPIVLVIAIIMIALFCSVFYKRHRWEMNEQRYKELNARIEREKSSGAMQQ